MSAKFTTSPNSSWSTPKNVHSPFFAGLKVSSLPSSNVSNTFTTLFKDKRMKSWEFTHKVIAFHIRISTYLAHPLPCIRVETKNLPEKPTFQITKKDHHNRSYPFIVTTKCLCEGYSTRNPSMVFNESLPAKRDVTKIEKKN